MLNTHVNGHQQTRPFSTPRALYLQVADDILARINAGEWTPGSILPNEADFARLYGTSQGTMRTALNTLESKGFITRKAGRGTFVNNKEADDQKRMRACVGRSLLIIGESIRAAKSKKVPAKLQTSLQTHIAEALFQAGYSEEAGQ